MTEPVGDWDSSTEQSENYYDLPATYDEAPYTDFGSWLRRKRALDSPGDDLQTAEQVLFRPTFRYKQLVKKREQSHRLRDELRRQSSPVPASSSPAVVALPPSPSLQRKYYSAYPLQSQRVYRPQVQRVYTQQPSRAFAPLQGAYSVNTPSGVPNYQRTQSSLQYPKTLQFTQNNQGFRPQRSPYAYLYSQRVN